MTMEISSFKATAGEPIYASAFEKPTTGDFKAKWLNPYNIPYNTESPKTSLNLCCGPS